MNGITRAAESLYISQPAVSRQISALEKEIGISLFHHVGRNIEPTPFGKELYHLLSNYTDEFRQLLDTYRYSDPRNETTINIAYLFNWNFIQKASHISSVFEGYCKNTNLAFHPTGISDAYQGLDLGKYDIILTMESDIETIPNHEKYSYQKVADIDRLILYSPTHPIHQITTDPTIYDFQDSIFYYYSEPTNETVMEKEIMRICQKNGFKPILQQKASWQTCLTYVQRGYGVVMTDAWAPEADTAQFLTAKLKDRHSIVLLWKNSNKNTYLSALQKSIVECLAMPST